MIGQSGTELPSIPLKETSILSFAGPNESRLNGWRSDTLTGRFMAKFQTVIKSARFVYSPYTATEMQGFGQVLADSIRTRIRSAQNIYDQAAAPLKPGLAGRRGYPDYKAARGSPAHPRLDVERAHPAVPEGPDRERKPRGDRVSR